MSFTLESIGAGGMQNGDLVLHDEDAISAITEFEDLSNTSETSVIPSSVNIENSTDVILGPVTQFHGPVTIVQNPNSLPTAAIREKKAQKLSQENGHLDVRFESKPPIIYSKYAKYIGGLLVVALVAAVAITGVILVLKHDTEVPTSETPIVPDDPTSSGLILEKKSWGGRPALSSRVLKHPIKYVIVAHTVTPFCNNITQCSMRVRSIQAYHVGSGKYPDIGYNFIVGGDGNAYVGRGWDKANFMAENSIGIAFIGDYTYDNLRLDMVEVTKRLLAEGLQKGKLDEDYILIAHNQTYATESPGRNVYSVIATWPHFSAGDYTKLSE